VSTCPNCGNKGALLALRQCHTCGRQACGRCMKLVGTSFPDAYGNRQSYKSCGWPCLDRAVRDQVSHGVTVGQWGGAYTFRGMVLSSEASYIALKIQAETFVVAERREDAATTYEKIGMWKEAGELRRKIRSQVVTQVHVNMNDLIDQLRQMGLSATYACPSCRSPITVNGSTSPDKLAKCQFCGTVFSSTDLMEAITRVVGHH